MGQRVRCAAGKADEAGAASKLLIVECDGVLVDVHKTGHLAAFNLAFHDLGLDCAHWTPVVTDSRPASNGLSYSLFIKRSQLF